MMARAMKLAELETNLSGSETKAILVTFTDGAAVAAWAEQSVAAAVKHGIVKGAESRLMPTDNLTRAEAASLIQRWLRVVIGIDQSVDR